MKLLKSKSNKGAGLLSVIIAMAVVGILGTLVLSLALTNFNMKVIDKNSKNNFYTAESALEDICAGLEGKMSEQYIKAYSEIMTDYGKYDETNENQMALDFKTAYIIDMVAALKDTGDASKYDISTLSAFVGSYPGSVSVCSYDASEGLSNSIETLVDGLVLRNVRVKYTEGNYSNTITTDIKISVPELNFSLISASVDVSDYTYIAQGGVSVTGGNSLILGQKAKAFSGNIDLDIGATYNATNASLVITNGAINLKGGTASNGKSATFTTGEATTLWATDILTTANSSSIGKTAITLLGKTYIKDDTTLNGSGNSLTIGGQYYGYSAGTTDAASSSSIIVNGSNTTLRFEDSLSRLVVAGTSYIATSTIANETNMANINIKMADSIVVKGNQIAYLVPTECAGISSNPMTVADYTELKKNTNWKSEALNTVISSLRRSIASFAGAGNSVDITPVAYTGVYGSVVYLYVSFTNTADAASYYAAVYGSGNQVSKKLKEYQQAYIGAFSLNRDTSIITAGNYLTGQTKVSASTYDANLIARELVNDAEMYEALCAKLVTTKSSLTASDLSKDVFTNIISYTNVQNFGTASGVVLGDRSGICAIIVNNEGRNAYSVSSNGKGIIIATGDVTITGGADWEGVIICKGKLTITGNSTLTGSSSDVNVALNLVSADENWIVQNFFIGGEKIKPNTSNTTTTTTDKTDIRNCLSYENYRSN